MCTKNCLCNTCHKRNKCSDCPYIDMRDVSNNPWSLICSTTGIQSCDYYINPPEINREVEEENQKIIKFKNGSTIEVIETNGDNICSKMHNFQYEDMSEYIKYMKQHPCEFAELILGKKLNFIQRAYLGCVSILYSKGDIDVDDMVRKICKGK